MLPVNLKLTVFAFIAMFLVGCENVTVTSPVEGEVYITAQDFSMEFTNGLPEEALFELNGVDVTSLFAIDELGAMAPANSMEEFLVNGENAFRVAKPTGPIVHFFMDLAGPMVHITDASFGNVVGYLEDLSGSVSLTLNGEVVELAEDGSFSTMWPIADFYTFVAVDVLGYTTERVYASGDIELNDTIGMRFEQSAIDFIVDEITTQLVSGTDFNDSIAEMDIIDMSLRPLGITLLEITLEPTGGYLGDTADISLDIVESTTEGRFLISGTLPDLNMSVNFDARVPGILGALFRFTLDDMQVSTTVSSFSSDIIATANGDIIVDLENMSIELDDIQLDLGIFPSWLGIINGVLDFLVSGFANIFSPVIELIVEPMLETMIPDIMQSFFDVIPTGLEFNIGGKIIKPIIDPESISSPSGGIEIKLGSRIFASQPEHSAFGSWYQGTGPLPQLSTTPPGGVANQMAFIVSADMINQTLAAAFESGLIHFSLTLDTGEVSLGEEVIGAGTFLLEILPKSPPTLEFVDSDTSLGRLAMDDLEFRVSFMAVDATEFQLLFGANMDFDVMADIGVGPATVMVDGVEEEIDVLTVGLEQLPVIRVHSIADGGSIPLGEITINSVITTLMPLVIPAIGDLIAIPLPSFEGYGLSIGGLWVPEGNTGFIALAADLIPE